MLCPFCGSYARDDELVCPRCAKVLPRPENRDTGVRAIRQGKRARLAAQEGRSPMPEMTEPVTARRQGQRRSWVDVQQQRFSGGQIPIYSDPEVYNEEGDPVSTAGFDRRRRRAWDETSNTASGAVDPTPRSRRHIKKKKHYINMAWVAVWSAVLLLVLLIGAWVFFTQTGNGQVILARYGREANSAAYWQVGSERMDTGDISGAIEDFEHARALDEEQEEEEINVPGLLMLASCYEAAGRTEDAEEIYIWLYTDVVPSASDAYTAEIRILLNTGRRAEAADLMTTAYQMTGLNSYRQQRTELIPAQPIVNYTAGPYEYKITLRLESTEGYDIYYTFDEEAELPADGILYEAGTLLDEGTWKLRAVCVNEDLVSDELTGTYRVSMPSPQQPYAHLAPNTYKNRQKVALSVGEENQMKRGEEYSKEKDITIYYTIDGSIPDADSPIYDGTPISLPTGWVTLHAVAVNGYGKASTTLERTYKIEARPWPKSAYTTEDVVNNVKLNTTGWDEFFKLYGEAERTEDVSLSGMNDCRRRYYSWGYATFARSGNSQLLVEMCITNTSLKGPRSTKVGDTESAIVSQFRDMEQVASPSGNRGLYSNSDGTGKIYLQADGSKIIRYVAYTADSHYWRLDYNLNTSGVCTSIYMLFIP